MTIPELQNLPWDSNFLGFLVGQVAVSSPGAAAVCAAVAQARQQGLRLTYLLLDPADGEAVAAARRAGATLVDRKVTLRCPVSPPGPRAAANGAVVRTQECSPELEKLAWESGGYSRFRLDPHFGAGVFEQLYSQWLRASLSGELARAVFAYQNSDNRPTGLLTLQPHGSVASIGLLAVGAEARGQGQGRILVEAAQQAASDWGCSELRVITQLDNVVACRFYAQCGFLVEQEVHVYHLWHHVRAI